MITILAEKPSQAKAYADAYKVKNRTKHYIEIEANNTFPGGAIITWGIGHLVELNPPEFYDEKYKKWDLQNLPIIPESFSYSVSKDKKDHFKEVKRILQKTDECVIATDIDREGEAIARLILQESNASNKAIKRLWINSLEKDEIRKGMANLRNGEETYNFFIEAQARQISDWLIGMNLSPLYSILLQQKGFSSSLGIGRVQSPTVYMIYQRQKEIENFVSKPFYQIEGQFEVENGKYKGLTNIKEESKEVVRNLLSKHNIKGNKEEGHIQSIDKKEKRSKAPKLHSLSTLQSTANKKWKYSPSQVLKIMQKLYEKKIVTYPRTDCNYITENEFQYITSNLISYQNIIGVSFEPKTLEPTKRFVDGSKVEEHYAIVPTKTIPNESVISYLNVEEKNIYFEVICTTLGMFHEDYIYEETTIITNVNELEFKSTGKVEKEKGWKDLFPTEKKSEQTVLPEVTKDEKSIADVAIKEGMTKPPKPYTEGQLINMMKTCGKLVEDDEDVEILKEIEGLGTEATRSSIIDKIKQQKYIEVKNNIVSVTPKGKILCESIEGSLLSSPSMTAKWESFLQKIGEGNASKEQFINQTTSFIKKQIEEVPKKLKDTTINISIQKEKESNHIAKCPSCKKGYIQERKIKGGKNFYSCSGYAEGCKISFPKSYCGKTLSKTVIKNLCEKKETGKIKGFKSKRKEGKTFDAKLTLNEEYQLRFKFK
ncbi:type IA DNA topoisomerase [Virgibacillus salexigens]|uniref:type IA DNA topoisomerase n=1 Tax=Virgibacillus massiliensis TaxID=1462526 RepID=UPI00136FD10A|nr:type IA DNA topoisomerase [Virgibacillus massiliensis]MYL43990.1 DNA topoisomerase III [Virgibacillus massiliensis]